MKKIIFSIDPTRKNENHAGSKALDDIEEYLCSDGFSINYICNRSDSKLKRLFNIILKLPSLFRYKNDLVMFQYPVMGGALDNILVNLYLPIFKMKKCNTVLLIHDLESLRDFRGNKKHLNHDINIINNFDYVIVHNRSMEKWLQQCNVQSELINLELFDYKLDSFNLPQNREYNSTVAFPGNLSPNKSGFIYKLNEIQNNSIKYSLYGPNLDNFKNNEFISYKGVFPPEQLPEHIVESFGLLWDGPSLFTCTGTTGEYMKYNNPHKFSLYIACGLPVIVWDQAAVSSFVRKYDIGICVNSIEEIEEKLNTISEDQYIKYLNNVSKLSEKVRNGFFIKDAVNKIILDIEK